MAIARSEIQVIWSTALFLSIAAAGNGTSDAITPSANGIAYQITLKADNGGTPASGDTVDFFLMRTSGDPDGTATDEYDTAGDALPLGTLDTNSVDPALMTVDIPVAWKGAKLYAVNNSAANSIVVSAAIYEVTG